MEYKKVSLLIFYPILFLFLTVSCKNWSNQETLFQSLLPGETNVDFKNELNFEKDFNIYRYRNFYNGGGVAAGDLNNDGLPDIYFINNMGDNRLYLNEGNFQFTDVTEQAGVKGKTEWSAGASFVDINGDGLLDIYVVNSGEFGEDERRNELFVNNGDMTFTEMADEYGLDDPGYGIQAYFFDYNGDGLIDMYLLNNSDEAIGNFDISNNQRDVRDQFGGDKLFRNDGGSFTDVSEEAGIYGSEIGFSLSAPIADLNRDGWPDIYVANDFFERDYLYMNNQDGTFREVLSEQMPTTSLSSMGADIADFTNDGWPEIYVADMYPYSEERKKSKMHYETYEEYQRNVEKGFHYQVTRNTLQLNQGDSTFSEIGRLAGIEATDWSWSVLLADFDHNGHTDIHVTNGIFKDLLDQD